MKGAITLQARHLYAKTFRGLSYSHDFAENFAIVFETSRSASIV